MLRPSASGAGASISPPQGLTFTTADAQSFSFTAGAVLGGLDLSLDLIGVDAQQYPLLASLHFTVLATAALSVSCSPPVSEMLAGQSVTCVLQPSLTPVHGALNVSLLLSGGGGGSVTPANLNFSSSTPASVVVAAASPSGVLRLDVSLSGTDVAQFVKPDSLA
jgi:hypothetical protein